MINFLHVLFYDQLCRVETLLNTMRVNPGNSAVPRFFVERTVELLTDLKVDIETFIDSGELAIDKSLKRTSNIVQYNRYEGRFKVIEITRCQVITRYGDREIEFSRLLERIYRELDIHQEPPVVAFVSDAEDYYWAYPKHDIIAVPAGEERHLLNLPDLYHEIGHFIYSQHDSVLIRDIIDELTGHFNKAIKEAEALGKTGLSSLLATKRNRWESAWIEEFVCDVIAAHTTGPAYAWTNFKISSIVSKQKNIYTDYKLHPSDEARMQAICFVLQQDESLSGEMAELYHAWNIYRNARMHKRPRTYELYLPTSLIEKLADRVLQGCRNIGLRSYREQISFHVNPISKTLNEAWQQAMASPRDYAQWEVDQINRIKAE